MQNANETQSYFDRNGREMVEEKAKALGHAVTISGVTMDDTAHCSCGWKGKPFWDGRDLAWMEWQEHFLTESSRMSEQSS